MINLIKRLKQILMISKCKITKINSNSNPRAEITLTARGGHAAGTAGGDGGNIWWSWGKMLILQYGFG